jgi:hypothetical protein
MEPTDIDGKIVFQRPTHVYIQDIDIHCTMIRLGITYEDEKQENHTLTIPLQDPNIKIIICGQHINIASLTTSTTTSIEFRSQNNVHIENLRTVTGDVYMEASSQISNVQTHSGSVHVRNRDGSSSNDNSDRS